MFSRLNRRAENCDAITDGPSVLPVTSLVQSHKVLRRGKSEQKSCLISRVRANQNPSPFSWPWKGRRGSRHGFSESFVPEAAPLESMEPKRLERGGVTQSKRSKAN